MFSKKYIVFLNQSHSINVGNKVGQGGEENCHVQKRTMSKTCQPEEEQNLYSFILKFPEKFLQRKGI